MECSTHSPWISRLLGEMGHQVIVANARKLKAISQDESKCDQRDALTLAQLAQVSPLLLAPVQHRSRQRQTDLSLLKLRDGLVRARTVLVNCTRGLVKSAGGRLPACSTAAFAERAAKAIPAELAAAAQAVLNQVAELSAGIKVLDGQIEQLTARYPEIGRLRTVPGVGPVVATTFVLTLDGPEAMRNNRSAGAFLGLRPRRDQSGKSDPERPISKTGNGFLRRLLVQSAHYILGRFGPDSALRQWGLKLAGTGKSAKKRAVVAVARKLATILHSIWKSGQVYRPFPQQAAGAGA